MSSQAIDLDVQPGEETLAVGSWRGVIVDGPVKDALHSESLQANGHADLSGLNFDVILSVYPAGLRREVDSLMYELPAAPKGEFRGLRVYPTYTQILNTVEEEGRGIRYRRMPIPARSRANDVYLGWRSMGMAARSNFPIGVGLIAGGVPTEAELEALRNMQERNCRWYVREADKFADSHEFHKIMAHHRAALDWLGDHDSKRHVWYRQIKQTDVKECLACRGLMDAKALICSTCHTNQATWCMTMRLEVDEVSDPVLYRAVQILATNTEPAQPAQHSVAKSAKPRKRTSTLNKTSTPLPPPIEPIEELRPAK